MTGFGTLPPGLNCYRRSSDFTHDSVPQALLASHSVKKGVWGLLRVTSGRVRYHLEGPPPASRVVAAGGTAVIEPEMPHHVELLDADSSFFIEFHRAEGGA